jgi:hypothetical protein
LSGKNERIVEDFNRLTLNDKEAMSSLKKGPAKRRAMADLRRDLESD